MTQDMENYSREEKEKIARMARRSVKSETTLIWGFGGAALALFLTFIGMKQIVVLALNLGVSPTGLWLFFSFTASGGLAFFHAKRLRPKIERAEIIHSGFIHEQQLKRRAEVENKLKEMNKTSKDKT